MQQIQGARRGRSGGRHNLQQKRAQGYWSFELTIDVPNAFPSNNPS